MAASAIVGANNLSAQFDLLFSASGEKITAWLEKIGAKNVAIYLDFDALNPTQMRVAVGDTGILSPKKRAKIIKKIAKNHEIVGFTMNFPKLEIQPQDFLKELPFFRG